MRKIPRAIYLSADELDEVIAERAAEAAMLSPGTAKQSILKEVAQLRMYAAAKRWMQPQDSTLQASKPLGACLPETRARSAGVKALP
jgi:hypothetical protein